MGVFGLTQHVVLVDSLNDLALDEPFTDSCFSKILTLFLSSFFISQLS